MLFGGGLLLVMAACAGAYDYYDDRVPMTQVSLVKKPVYDQLSRYKIFQMLSNLQNSGRIRDETTFVARPYGKVKPRRTIMPSVLDNDYFFENSVMKRSKANVTSRFKHRTSPRRKWRINRPTRYCLLKICGALSTFSYD